MITLLEEIRRQLFQVETQTDILIEMLEDTKNVYDEGINYELEELLEYSEDLKSDLDNKEDILYLLTKGE